MKRFCILLAALGMSLQAFGQEDPPVLIRLSSEDQRNRPVVYIETDCVRDTMKAVYMVDLRFDKNFGEGIRIDEPKQISPRGLIYFDDAGKKRVIWRDDPKSEFESCIYDACANAFRELLKRQPYSDMEGIERFYGYNAFRYNHPVRLIPKKPNPAE